MTYTEIKQNKIKDLINEIDDDLLLHMIYRYVLVMRGRVRNGL